jgi:hypothetical protein
MAARASFRRHTRRSLLVISTGRLTMSLPMVSASSSMVAIDAEWIVRLPSGLDLAPK